jgi:hypothetical protein
MTSNQNHPAALPDRAAQADQPGQSAQPDGRLPPRPAVPDEEARQARARRDAAVRGVPSIAAMRDAIRDAARTLPLIDTVPRIRRPDAAAFRARAAQGLPFLIEGVVGRWPLCGLDPDALRAQFGEVPVRARVGDYINTAFAPDRAMRDMSLRAYLDLVAAPAPGSAALRRQPGIARHEPPVPLARLFRQDGTATLLAGTGGHGDAIALRLRRQYLRPDPRHQAHHAGPAAP